MLVSISGANDDLDRQRVMSLRSGYCGVDGELQWIVAVIHVHLALTCQWGCAVLH